MAVGVIGPVDAQVEVLLAELLLVVAAQTDAERVEGVVLEAREVVLAPAGLEQHRAQDVIVGVQVLDVRRAGEHGHLLVDLRVDRGRHREQRLDDLVVGVMLGAAAGEHRRRQRRHALLAGRVVGRPGAKQNAERDQRRFVALEQSIDGRRAGAAERISTTPAIKAPWVSAGLESLNMFAVSPTSPDANASRAIVRPCSLKYFVATF